MSEVPVVRVQADVMQYDSAIQKWVPCQGSGASVVHLYQSLQNQTYRIIGLKQEDSSKVSVNSGVIPTLIYNEATPRFHQWRAQGTVYGLNFATPEMASDFAHEMKIALQYVKGELEWPLPQGQSQPPPPPIQQVAPRPPVQQVAPRPPMPPSGSGPPRPPMGGAPRPPMGGPPRPPMGGPPGPPPGPAPPGPPRPPAAPSGGPPRPPVPGPGGAAPGPQGGDVGRGALLASIQQGARLRKVGPPAEKEGPGSVLGEPKKESAPSRQPPSGPSRPGPGGPPRGPALDFGSELARKIGNRNKAGGNTNPVSSHTVPRPVKTEPVSSAPSSAPSYKSNPVKSEPPSTNQNSDIQKIIQEELQKMKRDFLEEFRQMIRDELRNAQQ